MSEFRNFALGFFLFSLSSVLNIDASSIRVKGIITGNVRWSVDTVFVDSTLVINHWSAVASLSIQPGTVLLFAHKARMLVEYGPLYMNGTSKDSIYLRPQDPTKGWGGFFIGPYSPKPLFSPQFPSNTVEMTYVSISGINKAYNHID